MTPPADGTPGGPGRPPRDRLDALLLGSIHALPYAFYLLVAALILVTAWDKLAPGWFGLIGATVVALTVVQATLDAMAQADAYADATSPSAVVHSHLWTMPITLICVSPIALVGACVITHKFILLGCALLIVCPVIARVFYDRRRHTGKPGAREPGGRGSPRPKTGPAAR